MSSVPGLPTKGSDVIVHITRVHLHPLCVLVEFWGKFSQERLADYERLSKSIQSPGATFKVFEGNPGDQCLVQVDDTWYRARVVSRNGSKYSVFLIDKGIKCSATTSKLAWGKRDHFQLPPEVEFCVLSNVLSLLPENRWSPMALEFLRSLTGKSVTAHVQDVLIQHRMFLLHIPSISNQMYEMGLAKKVSALEFQDFVFTSLKSHHGTDSSPEITPLSMEAGERLDKRELFLYPELPAATAETVIVTEVTNPQRIFCQLKVFSRELKKLTEQITQNCESRMSSCVINTEMIGFPCASRGSNGRWYRSVLQQVFPTNKVVEVLNVDYGTKQLLPLENVRPLASEFFRLPVVTYICSLHGIIDKGVGWTTSQIDFLRSLLLFKTVIAKFEYQSISEGVYYITLYGDDNTNINNLFGSKEGCLLKQDNAYVDYAIRSTANSCQNPGQQGNMLTSGQSVEEKERRGIAEALRSEELSVNSSYLAVVQHISNPSEFWIQTENYKKELDELQDSIHHLYKDSVSMHVVRNPTLGFFCAAKADDDEFYRATVTEVRDAQVGVFFVDYGNTEVVDRSNIRTLPPELRKLPKVALKCCLDSVRPKDGRWSPSASEFFISAVTGKVLNVHVKAKYKDSYVVQLMDPRAQHEKDVGSLMCSSGHAEKAEMQKIPRVKNVTQVATTSPTEHVAARPPECKNVGMSLQTQSKVGLLSNEGGALTFKEQMFPTGSVLDVSVSYIESPNDFWCQLAQNAWQLRLLMNDLQTYYTGSEFQPEVKTACVARHPDNGMWYRALVVCQHKTPHVDVLFVDYGQTETVSLYDLRGICPEFLTLHGQAFRCSLINLVDSTSATNEWNEEAKTKFLNFVENAASNFVVLKCTIYAVMYSEKEILYNVVDLETPFESICVSLARLVTSVHPVKTAGSSFRLNSYFYSTHNIKTGTEERVTVTCVNNISQFYCHLDRNADAMKDLNMKVNNLCHQLEKVKLPTVFGTLCFARFTDGKWYRAQIKAIRPAILVHFVDYGDTIEVDKSDLLPVPKEANKIMSAPVQAVVCGLSDIPADVPSEVNSWFEMAAKECEFRALIVAREPDGKLLVELYHGNTQINAKIKKVFQTEMQIEEQAVYQSRNALETSANHVQKMQSNFPKQEATDNKDRKRIQKKNISASELPQQMTAEKRSTDLIRQSSQKHELKTCENSQKTRHPSLEPYVPPHQRRPCGTAPSIGSEPADVKPAKETLHPEAKRLKSNSPCPQSKKENGAEKLPKLTDLPSKNITPGMVLDVYISHCSSPLSFYVQRIDEDHTTNTEVPEIPNFGSVESVTLGETLTDDPKVQALLKSFEKSSEQLLWRRWSRRSSGTSCSTYCNLNGAATSAPSSSPRRVLQPPSPLDVYVANQDIQVWMGRVLDWENGEEGLDKDRVSMSSEEGVCSLSALDSDEEDAYSYILDLNTGGFQSPHHLKIEVPIPEEGTAEEMREESEHLETHGTFNGCRFKHQRGSTGQGPDFNQEPAVKSQSAAYEKFNLDKNKSNQKEMTNHRDVFDLEPESEKRSKDPCEEESNERAQSDDDGGCHDGEREKTRKTARQVKDGYDKTETDEEKAKVFEAASRQRNVKEEKGRKLSGKWGCEDERRRVDEGRLWLRSSAASCDITPLELEMLPVLWILLYCYFILPQMSL
ncbi:tudor domain-containing 6 [Xenentodon cancila]